MMTHTDTIARLYKMNKTITLWDLNNPNGIELKGTTIKKYALNNLTPIHRIGEDTQIQHKDINNIKHALEYLKEICNFDIKEVNK